MAAIGIGLIRYSDRPDLWDDTGTVTEEVWPEYNHHGDVLNNYWHRLFDEFPGYQFVLYDEREREVVAEGHTAPCCWDGTSDCLGDGIDEMIVAAFAARERGSQPCARWTHDGAGRPVRLLSAGAGHPRQVVAQPRDEELNMKRLMGTRGIAALIVSVIALVVAAPGTSSATTSHQAGQTSVHHATKTSAGPVTKTFSLIGKPGSKAVNVVNIDGLTINARCGTGGQPVIFAFSNVPKADIFGRIFDGAGRLHTIHNTSFTNKASVQLSPSSGDFDASGNVLFETSTGKVVTVQYALDNATTLGKQNVCTVFGSVIAS